MTKTYARLIASCSLTLSLLAGVGCDDSAESNPAQTPDPGGSAGSSAEPSSPSETPKPSDKPSETPSNTPGDKPSDTPSNSPSANNPKPTNPPANNPPATDPQTPGQNPDPNTTDPKGDSPYPDLRGTCDIKSAYGGDEKCVKAPSAEEGMQLHVGPKNYDDEAEVAQYLMEPGDESSLCWTFKTPNTEDIYYQTSLLSGRDGTHHIINTMFQPGAAEDGGFRACDGDRTMQVGSIPGASKSYMPRGTVAPEYVDVGRKIIATATIQSDMHYFNFTDKTILREYWLNIYYAPKEDIKREALPIRGFGGLGWRGAGAIQPGTDMVYKYACPIVGDGHILNLLGHYHSHGKRFTASLIRKSGEVEKVFEMFNYEDPATFEYNSVVSNPEFSTINSGAVSGQLAVADGDQLQWECHIINDGDVPLTYINEVKNGEMCNMWGASVGTQTITCDHR
jgi:hypothetical protein